MEVATGGASWQVLWRGQCGTSLGPPARRQSPVRALCSVILGFTLLAATLALVLSWLLATGILDPGAPARAQAARKLDLARLPEPSNDITRLSKLAASTAAPT